MNTSIVGRNIDLTDAIKNYAESAFEALKKYNLDIISANITIQDDKKGGTFTVEFVINLKDKHTVVISQKDKDVYAAIDLALERVKKNLRRYADKIKDHNHESLKTIEQESTQVADTEDDEDEFIPLELELYKPLTFDEAKDFLEASGKDFFVFNDNDGNTRVICKLDNGKYGIY